MSLFPHIFAPLKVGSITLPNRIIMGSMHTNLEEDFGRLNRLARYFAERAAGGVGLIVTGGISPNRRGWLKPFGAKLTNRYEVFKHAVVTKAVHDEGGLIAMQILHAGRYGYHPFSVAPSKIKSPITPFSPSKLSNRQIEKTIEDFVHCATLAQEAGYDGVEVMGSEGYLINQFIVTRTNKRDDEWGGVYENRIRIPIEIVKRTREVCGSDFIIMYRLSMIDLVEEGSNWEEVVQLAKEIEKAGASIINTGIGWHEARVPTIATSVPRGSFSWVTHKLKGEVSIPLVTSNRINMPQIAEDILEKGHSDLISMARPFLADSHWVIKAKENRVDEINTCIACNQACLDHAFKNKRVSCLVNPRACYETELNYTPAKYTMNVAVVGAGPAGLAYATVAAMRGHKVTLFEKSSEIGGQFNLAKIIPGKEEFHETIRYFNTQLEKSTVSVILNKEASIDDVRGFEHVVIATGVRPRKTNIEGEDHAKVISYIDVLRHKVEVGSQVAIIGSGGIGFDVATYLSHPKHLPKVNSYLEEWGIDPKNEVRGGIEGIEENFTPNSKKIVMFQRSSHKPGSKLGKTTGWIHRSSLKKRNVQMLNNIQYVKIDDEGLHYKVKMDKGDFGDVQVFACDNVVICAGQLSNKELFEQLKRNNISVECIGGSDVAVELDAKRAINQGSRSAASL